MQKILILLAICVSTLNINSQTSYWQQEISYSMNVNIDDENNQFDLTQNIIYKNNSNETLDKIYIHLYYNAFQPNSMMDIRSRTIKDPDERVGNRIFSLKEDEIGYHNILDVKQNGIKIKYVIEETIMIIYLNKKLTPKSQTNIEIKTHSQIPVMIRRSGRENNQGVKYTMTQWYPKVCEYDKDGWHSNPYIGREFHGVFGTFDVNITINKDYIIGGTGIETKKITNKNKTTWSFHATKIHDFAWAADKKFVVEEKKLNNGTKLKFIYIKDSNTTEWPKVQDNVVKGFEFMNQLVGKYPYSQYSIIQGGDGGMEYPMCTMINSDNDYNSVLSVIIHESIHSWFQGVLASNEAKYPWIDEGFTSYYQYKTLAYINNSKFNLDRSLKNYTYMVTNKIEEPLTTHADHYDLNTSYGISSYNKGALFLNQICYIVGNDAFDRTMKKYYSLFQFKHPDPNDVKRLFEKETSIELDWFFENFVQTIKSIDYKIDTIFKINENESQLIIKNISNHPMPIDFTVYFTNGDSTNYCIPLSIMRGTKKELDNVITLSDWNWVDNEYKVLINKGIKNISRVEIDITKRLADINLKNNKYEIR